MIFALSFYLKFYLFCNIVKLFFNEGLLSMKVIRIELGPFNVNCYVLLSADTNEAVVIDPSVASLEVKRLIGNVELKYVLNTHGHFDHIGGNNFIQQGTDAKIVIHEKDAALLADPRANLSTFFTDPVYSHPADIVIGKEGFNFSVGGYRFETISIPGHSECSVAYYCKSKGIVFSGDLIFPQSIGRTDLPGGNFEKLQKSIDVLLSLPDKTMVYPGHEDNFTLKEFKKGYKHILEMFT